MSQILVEKVGFRFKKTDKILKCKQTCKNEKNTRHNLKFPTRTRKNASKRVRKHITTEIKLKVLEKLKNRERKHTVASTLNLAESPDLR